jgi:hypothetical protein
MEPAYLDDLNGPPARFYRPREALFDTKKVQNRRNAKPLRDLWHAKVTELRVTPYATHKVLSCKELNAGIF